MVWGLRVYGAGFMVYGLGVYFISEEALRVDHHKKVEDRRSVR